MNIKLLFFIVLLILPAIACGGSDALDPAGNAQTVQGDNYTMYKYPDNDQYEYCIVYDDGAYECQRR